MSSRSRAREQALQILYLIDLAGTPAEQALSMFRANFESNEEDFEFVKTLVQGVVTKKIALDALIESHSEHWRLSRMPRVDRNVLRIGAFELTGTPDVPTAVAIDEAIELGKKYGETRTPAFINGILDRISKEVRDGVRSTAGRG
ncbi:MAG TPA: transcription antitermination factor NusB [Bdellovibrionota bacterium]|nr:transcription antitermination factor NusB [Bdellovibrionota bacterium]